MGMLRWGCYVNNPVQIVVFWWSNRIQMRSYFKVLLPVAQAVLAIALLSSHCGAPRFVEATGPPDWQPSGPPTLPSVVSRFVGSNLPAVPVLAPAYALLGGPEHPNTPWLVALVGLVGIGIWFFVGQFLDDVAALWKGLGRRRHIYDGLFSVFIIASSCIVFVESDITGIALSLDESVVRGYSLGWLVFGCTTLLFQVVWSRKTNMPLGSFVLNK